MHVIVKPLSAQLGKAFWAVVSDEQGTPQGCIIITGHGPAPPRLLASCDCEEASHPCSHILALRRVKGFARTEDLKRS